VLRTVVCTLSELVLGSEQCWLDEGMPLACRRGIALDLHAVVRIDAAGIAALVRLYLAAHQARRSFRIVRSSRHVKETIHIVGLERLLLYRNVVDWPRCGKIQVRKQVWSILKIIL